jgi:hypothetical protein
VRQFIAAACKAVEFNSMAREEKLMIELTEKQRQAVRNGEAIRIPAPEIGEDVVLLRATEYENMQELVEDTRLQRAVLRCSMEQAGKAALENSF